MVKLVSAFAVVVVVSACAGVPASDKIAVMYNPDTKSTAECRVDPVKDGQWSYKDLLNQCIAGYQAADDQAEDKQGNDKKCPGGNMNMVQR